MTESKSENEIPALNEEAPAESVVGSTDESVGNLVDDSIGKAKSAESRKRVVLGRYPDRFETKIPLQNVLREEAATLVVSRDDFLFLKNSETPDLLGWGEFIMSLGAALNDDLESDVIVQYNIEKTNTIALPSGAFRHYFRGQRFFYYLSSPIIQGSNEMSYEVKDIEKVYIQVSRHHWPQDRLKEFLIENFFRYTRKRRADEKFKPPLIPFKESEFVEETLLLDSDFQFLPGVHNDQKMMRTLFEEAMLEAEDIQRIVENGFRIIDIFSLIEIAKKLEPTRVRREAAVVSKNVSSAGTDVYPLKQGIDEVHFEEIDEFVTGVTLNLENYFTNPTGIACDFLSLKDWRWIYPHALVITSYQDQKTGEEENRRHWHNIELTIDALLKAKLPIFILIPNHWKNPKFADSVTSKEVIWMLENLGRVKRSGAEVFLWLEPTSLKISNRLTLGKEEQ